MPSKIYISYRRKDNSFAAQRIFEALKQSFGQNSLVFDVATIPSGVNFEDYIKNQIDQCAVMLAIVGEKWLDTIHKKQSDQEDYVRYEIEAALTRGIPVIPILLEDTPMPSAAALPDSLAEFSKRNALTVRSGKLLDFHLSVLVAELKKWGLKEIHTRDTSKKYWAYSVSTIALFLVIAAGFLNSFYKDLSNKTKNEITANQGMTTQAPANKETDIKETEIEKPGQNMNATSHDPKNKNYLPLQTPAPVPNTQKNSTLPSKNELSKIYSDQLKKLNRQLIAAEKEYVKRCRDELEPATKKERDQCHTRYYSIVEELKFEISKTHNKIAGLGIDNY